MTQVKQPNAESYEERYLRAAREAFPHWRFESISGGWQAVPVGAPAIRAETMDALVMKLRERTERSDLEVEKDEDSAEP